MSKPNIFISYSSKDKKLMKRLRTQLNVLELEDIYEVWVDKEGIEWGDEWKAEIDEGMRNATAAIFLVSADFLTSPFIRNKELPILLERHKNDGLRIFPVILKPCPWKKVK